MEQSPIRFDNAQGTVIDFVDDGNLDIEGFQRHWLQSGVIEALQSIASRQLNIEDLDCHPELKRALLEAYEYGKQAG